MSIAVDASHNVYISGGQADVSTTPGVFQPTPTGFTRSFVAKLNPAGSAPVYISYFGGKGGDRINRIAADASGNAYVVGATESLDFPLAHPLQSVYGGGLRDAFLSKISPGGDRLVYSTFIGGSGEDEAFGISVDPLGNAYVAGVTHSDNFPVTPGVFQPRFAGSAVFFPTDAFILKMNPEGSGLVYSSYLGGSGNDSGIAVAVDSSGNAYVAGTTNSPDFPLVRSIKSSFLPNGCLIREAPQPRDGRFDCVDLFVSRINQDGTALTLSTYFGGRYPDSATDLALDPSRNIYLIGTVQKGFPVTPGAYQAGRAPNGVVKIRDSSVTAQISAAPFGGGSPLMVHFEGGAVSDSGAEIVSYHWDFGNGTTGTGARIDHTYTAEPTLSGTVYAPILTATNADGETGSAFSNVTVADFSLRLVTASIAVLPGESTIREVRIQGGGVPVDLSCSTPSVPGLTCRIDPVSVFPLVTGEAAVSALTVSMKGSTPAGDYLISVMGRSGGAVHRITFALEVQPGDTFNRPDSGDLGPDWKEIVPDLALLNNQIVNVDTGEKEALFVWPIGPDQEVSVQCGPGSSSTCGVIGRWSDPKNFYSAGIGPGKTVTLFKTVDGATTVLGAVPLTNISGAGFYTFNLKISGSALALAVTSPGNPPVSINVTDSALSGGDYAGIRADASAPQAVQFENFMARPLSGQLPSGILFSDEFDRTGGLGENWKGLGGDYITDGSAAVSEKAVNGAVLIRNIGTNDYTVEAVVTIPAGALHSGVIARATPRVRKNPRKIVLADLYSAQIASDGSVSLYRRDWRLHPAWTLLKKVPAGIVPEHPYTLGLKVSGSDPVALEVSLDHRVLFTYLDRSPLRVTSGIPGIESDDRGVKYNRFTVYRNRTLNIEADSFERPSSSDLGLNWIEILPDFRITFGDVVNSSGVEHSYQMVETVNDGTQAAVWNHPAGNDQAVSVDCRFDSFAEQTRCGVMARWVDPDNFYWAGLDKGQQKLFLLKVVKGIPTLLGLSSRSLTRINFYHIQLVARGDSLSVYFSDENTPAITATDRSLESPFAGIRSDTIGRVVFDNFRLIWETPLICPLCRKQGG